MKKRICTLALAIVLAVSMAIPAFAAQTNVKSDGFTLSEVNLIEETTIKVDKVGSIETETVKIYHVPANATITVDAADKVIASARYEKNSNGTYTANFGGAPFDKGTLSCGVLVTSNETLARLTTPNGTCFIKVGSNSSVGSSPDSGKTTSTTTQNSTSAPSDPASENTVKVAGQNRTPGQIQNSTSGGYIYTVNYGDTLYGLSNRFYGNGDPWKELQKANQEYLNETKDGIIFVGLNLVIPAELGGVHANVK